MFATYKGYPWLSLRLENIFLPYRFLLGIFTSAAGITGNKPVMGPKRLPSLTSYSNDIKGFVWLKHFEKKKNTTSRRRRDRYGFQFFTAMLLVLLSWSSNSAKILVSFRFACPLTPTSLAFRYVVAFSNLWSIRLSISSYHWRHQHHDYGIPFCS